MFAMTAEKELSRRAHDLLDILRSQDGWVSRTVLARISERNRLTPYDVELLQGMVDMGLIEMRRRDVNSPIGYAYDYKAK